MATYSANDFGQIYDRIVAFDARWRARGNPTLSRPQWIAAAVSEAGLPLADAERLYEAMAVYVTEFGYSLSRTGFVNIGLTAGLGRATDDQNGKVLLRGPQGVPLNTLLLLGAAAAAAFLLMRRR